MELEAISKIHKSYMPKIIWFLWFQGMETAPDIIKYCLESWFKYNPDWEVRFISNNNLGDYIESEGLELLEREIGLAAKSDIIRIFLLERFGGVWVDSTCFCTKSLNDWLIDLMNETDFFAFTNPGPDRMISSWFLASNKGAYLTKVYRESVVSFWKSHPGLRPPEKLWEKGFMYMLWKIFPYWGMKPFVLNKLKLYPYFWFHYIFNITYTKDMKFQELWNQTSKWDASGPHYLHGEIGILSKANHRNIEKMKKNSSSVIKLKWKVNNGKLKKGSILEHIVVSHLGTHGK